MATTPRQQIASPQSFTSDPLEQVFAKQTSDPISGANAMANMILARDERHAGQDQYLTNLHLTNQLAAQLAEKDMRNDLMMKALSEGHNYIGKGVDPIEMPAIAQLFTNPQASSGPDRAANLHRLLLAAQANELNAKAAHAGDAGQPTIEYQYQNTPEGTPLVTITSKGKLPMAQQVQQSGERANVGVTQGRGNPNFPGNPNAPFASRGVQSSTGSTPGTGTVGVDAATQRAWSQAHGGRPFPGTAPFQGN